MVALPQALPVLGSNEDKKGQWSYSSTLLLSWGYSHSVEILSCTVFLFLVEASVRVFAVCRELDLLNQFSCW